MGENEQLAKHEALVAANDMPAIHGTVDVDIPIEVLWESFTHTNYWARWNKCFYWSRNRDLIQGKKLIWCFQPIRWWYPYKMFAIANIVEVEKEKKVTWEVTAMPGFYARHTYHMEDLGDGRSRFGSWEQAMGAQIKLSPTRKFWTSHFTFVKDKSLEGAKHLEEVYKSEGKIDKKTLKPKRYFLFWLAVLLLLILILAASVGGWFYVSFLRPGYIEIAPGVTAITAGGGNSLVVEDGKDVLLVDTKFPPASDWLRKWIANKTNKPVTMVVNTHYHYDHTQGNINYSTAKIFAYKDVPDFMKASDREWWDKNSGGIPQTGSLVNETATVKVGAQDVLLTFPGIAHTHGDLWVYLRRGDKEIVVTGDVFSHGYYPFLDLSERGVDIGGLIKTIRSIAHKYPDAAFVPGHGVVASATDLLRFADYLEFLDDSVAQSRREGLTEDQAVANIDLTKWNLSPLPSYHGGTLCWATSEMNIRWVYQFQAGTKIQRGGCKF